MPAKPVAQPLDKPARVARAARQKPGPKFKLVSRDTNLPLRTFREVRERLDALTALLDLPSRASLMEYYLLAGMDREEQALGLVDDAPGGTPLNERLAALRDLPKFRRLSERRQAKVMAYYRRTWASDEKLVAASLPQGPNAGRNMTLEIDGTHKTLAEWSRASGAADVDNILWRIKKGWAPKDAVFTPVGPWTRGGEGGEA